MKILARKLLDIPKKEILNHITGTFTIVFDNGEMIDTTAKETAISRYFWEYHKQYDKLRLLKEHHISFHLLKGNEKKRLKNKTHLALIASITNEWYEQYSESYTNQDKLDMLRIGYEASNHYYNDFSEMATEYMNSVDINDLYNLVRNPNIQRIKEEGDYSQEGIKKIHSDVINEILTDSQLSTNNIARLLRSGLIKDSQLVQCIGPFGYPKDVDNHIFRYPIIRGYIEGFRSFYDSLTESRTAATALYLAKGHLRNVEYFSRKAQLIGMNLDTIHRGDCGSNNYIPWEITNKNDLYIARGIYYLAKDNTLKYIKGNETDLVGTIIPIRTIVGCNHKDPNGCCETCFGYISRNVIAGTNIGQQSGVTLASDNTQNVLSFKHVVSTGVYSKIVLSQEQSRYFSLSQDGLGYMVRQDMDLQGFKLVLNPKAMLNITSILNLKDISKISISRATDVSNIRVISLVNDEMRQEEVSLVYQGRKAYCSLDLLKFMKKQEFNIDSRGWYEIDLSTWDKEKVLFKCPPKQFSTVDFSKGISELIEASVKDSTVRDEMSPPDFIKVFVDYITQKIQLPLSVLISIAYSSMIVSMKNKDYSLPKPWTDKGMGIMKTTMAGRSLGAAMAYQEQNKLLVNTESFTETNRPDHIFDYMLLPQEVIKNKIHY